MPPGSDFTNRFLQSERRSIAALPTPHLQNSQTTGDAAVPLAAIFRIAGALEDEPQVRRVHFHPLVHPGADEFAVADVGGPLRFLPDIPVGRKRLGKRVAEAFPWPFQTVGQIGFVVTAPSALGFDDGQSNTTFGAA